jgi:hypothetical protein
MDKGFILYQELVEWYTAEKVARCTCEKGNEYRYEGQECTKNKSNYRIPVITEIMDPVEIAQSNYAKWYERNKNKKGFQEALEEIKMRKG